jgi:large subunit ribosomal protein L17
VFGHLQDKEAVKELFDVISAKIASRPGGYTRVIKLGKRVGDNAELAMKELVDYNEIYGKGKGENEGIAKKTRRAGGRKKTSEAKPPADVTEKKVPGGTEKEVPVEEPSQPKPKIKT